MTDQEIVRAYSDAGIREALESVARLLQQTPGQRWRSLRTGELVEHLVDHTHEVEDAADDGDAAVDRDTGHLTAEHCAARSLMLTQRYLETAEQ
jgi:hypothetical protein